MPEHSKELPPPGALRRTSRVLGLPVAIPGWLLFVPGLLWEFAEMTHTTAFLLEKMHANNGPLWLIVGGFLWLGVMVYRASLRQDPAKRADDMNRLVNTIVYAALKFEDLLNAQGPTAGQDEAIKQAMKDFSSALHRLAVATVKTVPSWDRSKYTDTIVAAWANLSQFNSDRPFSITLVQDVLSAIYDAEAKSKE